jgi:chemotaxis protein methyltransferase CheR
MFDALKISDNEFCALKNIMYEISGVRLLPTKKPLVIARLRKRLKELGMDSFGDYLRRIETSHGEELEIFVNAITTNETFFFRHQEQFEILEEKVLPLLFDKKAAIKDREMRIWSAACSSGEEPYSIAMVCEEFFKTRPGWKVSILASDINTDILDFCKRAVYKRRSVGRMPPAFLKAHFDVIPAPMRDMEEKYHLHGNIVNSVVLSQHNLLKPFLHPNFDIIFLRNALIYFDRSSKQRVVELIEKKLNAGGYLFISLAESLNDIQTHLCYWKMGVYQKQ